MAAALLVSGKFLAGLQPFFFYKIALTNEFKAYYMLHKNNPCYRSLDATYETFNIIFPKFCSFTNFPVKTKNNKKNNNNSGSILVGALIKMRAC